MTRGSSRTIGAACLMAWVMSFVVYFESRRVTDERPATADVTRRAVVRAEAVHVADTRSSPDLASPRLDSISALVTPPGHQSIATLTLAAWSHTDTAVREEAVGALGDMGDEAVIPSLEHALSDPQYLVREAAVAALADIGGDASAQALALALKDTDVSLREEAVDALGEIGGATAMRLLRQAAEDEHAMIRQAAAEYLSELSDSSRGCATDECMRGAACRARDTCAPAGAQR